MSAHPEPAAGEWLVLEVSHAALVARGISQAPDCARRARWHAGGSAAVCGAATPKAGLYVHSVQLLAGGRP
jgi:hypothetical protein